MKRFSLLQQKKKIASFIGNPREIARVCEKKKKKKKNEKEVRGE